MDDVTNSTGSAKQMYDVYANSLEAKISDLKRAFEGLYEKILSSDTLKWLVGEATQIITTLTNIDGKTIAFTTTVGGLIVVMSKLSALNKTLIAGEAVTGLSKFIAVLSGMSTVSTTINEATIATRAFQVAQASAIAQTEGVTGLKGAWLLLSSGIKDALASSVAFMATPLGLLLTALTATIGLVVAGFVAYKQHQEELIEKSKELKSALDGVNESLKNGDTKNASNNLDKIKKEYEEYKRLADLKKEYEEKLKTAGTEKNIAGMYGVSETEQYTATIKNLDQQLEEHKKVLNDAGISEEKFAQLQASINYQDQINTIKEMTKAQVENRINIEANQEEYNNYIAKIQQLYSEYQNLSAQENLSAEQKTRLGSVVDQLQGQFGNLNIRMDETGKVYIENSPLIQDSISYLNQEGVTVDTLSQIRINEARTHASCQVGDTQMTYSQVTQRIQYYKQEIAGIQQLMQAQFALAQGNGEIVGQNDTEYDVNDAEQNDAVEHRIRANAQARWNAMNVELKGLENKKSEIDKAYNSITLPNAPSGGGASVGGGNYMPSGGGSGKKGKEAKDYTDDIAKMQAKFDPDPYFELNNALKNVNNELEVNKTLLGSLTEGSPEYKQAQLQQIEIDKKKQVALQNLNNEQKKQSQVLKDYLTQYGFTFDQMGNMTNSQEQIKYWTDVTNAMTGSTEEDKAKKQEWIDWIKTLEDDTKDYVGLVNDKIPSVANQWSEVANQIKKTTDAMKKANEDTLQNYYDKLAGDILDDMKEEASKAEEEADQAEERAKKAIEDEKEAKAKYWEDRIKALQDELDALNDETADNEEKLRKLKAERALWAKETGNVFAKSKIADLDSKIKETEKTIKKDSLSKQIDDLNKQKDEDLKSYDERLKDEEDYYAKKKEEQKKANDDSLLEEKAYAKAKELIQRNNQTEILSIIKSHSKEYKDAGSLLSKNFNDGYLEEYNKFLSAFGGLGGKISTPSISTGIPLLDNIANGAKSIWDKLIGSDSSSSGSSSSGSSDDIVRVGDTVKISNSSGETVDNLENGTAISSSGDLGRYSGKNLKTTGYDNGYFRLSDSDGNVIGWARRDDIAKFSEGGRTPDNLSSDGAFAILHKKERVLNSDETGTIDEILNYVKNSGGIISQLSTQIGNPSNYSYPNLVGTNLNGIASNVTNNSSNSTTSQLITMPVTIVNEKGAEQFTEQKLYKAMDKYYKEQVRRYK